MTRAPVPFDLRSIGKHMSRRRYQRGTLSISVPGTANRPERKLPRGTFWGQWYQYVRQPDGSETRRRREKIITKDLAVMHGIARDYDGPLTKTDARRVLEVLIAEESGVYVPPDRQATFESVAREYMVHSGAGWGPHMVRGATNLIQVHLIAKLGQRPVAEITELELQAFLNGYVKAGASSSMLKKLLYHVRAIFKHARKAQIVHENPTEDLKAKSRTRPSERTLTLEECQRLLGIVTGRDHLIFRIFVQLGLRPEELFALRRNDLVGDSLRVDEAVVDGEPAPVKTDASAALVYVPPDLAIELKAWIDCSEGQPSDWLFQGIRGKRPLDANNYRNRVLKPAAIRANVGVTDTGEKDAAGNPILDSDVNFQVLRRTCATLFGDKAKDPKSTQAQLRHADASITLKHYQKSIPESVKAAALALEADLIRTGELNRSEFLQ